MKQTLIVVYDTDTDLHGLTVVDPKTKLPNGNNKVIAILVGDYADEIYNELVKQIEVND